MLFLNSLPKEAPPALAIGCCGQCFLITTWQSVLLNAPMGMSIRICSAISGQVISAGVDEFSGPLNTDDFEDTTTRAELGPVATTCSWSRGKNSLIVVDNDPSRSVTTHRNGTPPSSIRTSGSSRMAMYKEMKSLSSLNTTTWVTLLRIKSAIALVAMAMSAEFLDEDRLKCSGQTHSPKV